jgi:hypothetical protein
MEPVGEGLSGRDRLGDRGVFFLTDVLKLLGIEAEARGHDAFQPPQPLFKQCHTSLELLPLAPRLALHNGMCVHAAVTSGSAPLVMLFLLSVPTFFSQSPFPCSLESPSPTLSFPSPCSPLPSFFFLVLLLECVTVILRLRVSMRVHARLFLSTH